MKPFFDLTQEFEGFIAFLCLEVLPSHLILDSFL